MPDLGRDKVWWPMRQFIGKDKRGKKRTKEVFRNIRTGEVHEPVSKDGEHLGWNGEPPAVDGERVPIPSEAYRKGYERIDWGRGEKQEGEGKHGETN